MTTEQKIARILLQIGAVRFNPGKPVVFKSGIISPVYVDNRKLPFHPKEWQAVTKGFEDIIKKKKISFDALAGVAVGGVPHSSALAFSLKKPSVFIRKEAKNHGTKSLVEGGDIKNKKIILIEDMVSTGASSLKAVKEIKKAGGMIKDCLVIVSYDFKEGKDNFKNAGVKLHALTSFPVILIEATTLGILKIEEVVKIQQWFSDPHGWAAKNGFK